MKRSRKPINPRSARKIAYCAELDEMTPIVMVRAGYRCEARLDGCTYTPQETPHHRKRRSQGGTNALGNLLAVCTLCHDWIHAEPAKARDLGLLLRRNDPETLENGV